MARVARFAYVAAMGMGSEILVDIAFDAEVIHWRGPSPFHFLAVPASCLSDIRHAARAVSYGWGMVPVEVTIAGFDFRTALFPRDENYLLPLKDAVRKATGIALGDTVRVVMRVRAAER